MSKRDIPRTIPHELVRALWCQVKEARDDAEMARSNAEREVKRLNALLSEMKAAGLSDWLPTLEEVQAAFMDGE